MPTIYVSFSHEIESQVAIGDYAYYISGGLTPSSVSLAPGNALTASNPNINTLFNCQEGQLSNAIRFGRVKSFQNSTSFPNLTVVYGVNIYTDGSTTTPQVSDYVFFSKNNYIEQGSVKGYYASVKLKNNSNEYAELFTLSANIEESSK